MKKLNIMCFGVCAVLGLSSCIHTQVDDAHDAFKGIGTGDSEALQAKFADAFTYDNGANHSNGVRIYNNSGYDAQVDFVMDIAMVSGTAPDNYVDIITPFAGDVQMKATVIYDNGALVTVPFSVHVETIDNPIDPIVVLLTGGSAEGRTWQWWVGDDYENGNYSYIEGSWGCVGGGGYGWSATGPNWLCYGIGDTDEWTGQKVTMDEWVKFDIDGGPNCTVHYSDGTEARGTYVIKSGTTPVKEAHGWVGQLKLNDVLLPHQVNSSQYSWYLSPSIQWFDVAMLDDEHLIIIGEGDGAIVDDPNWGSGCTHWTFQVKK